MGADIHFHQLNSNEAASIAGLTVTPFDQEHPGKSYGYRLQKNEKVFVYSSDSEHGDSAYRQGYPILDFFRDADLLLFDAQYNFHGAVDSKAGWGHSSNILGVELAVASNVKRMLMFHHEHTENDRALDELLDQTRHYLKIHAPESRLQIDMAHDGLDIEI